MDFYVWLLEIWRIQEVTRTIDGGKKSPINPSSLFFVES
jgi:hypothetical protein